MGDDNDLVATWAKAWNTRDGDLLMSLFAQDAAYIDVALEKAFHGHDAIRTFFEGTFVTFPDFKVEVVTSTGSADVAAGEWVMTGTFLGESFGRKPTGKSFRVEGCCVMRLTDGRAVEHRDYWNPASFDAQVGE
jgi:steroid delta-isomerase-like uncharacterized protein